MICDYIKKYYKDSEDTGSFYIKDRCIPKSYKQLVIWEKWNYNNSYESQSHIVIFNIIMLHVFSSS